MATPAAKTVPTAIDVASFVAAVPDPVQRDDTAAIMAMMARLSGEPACMWGPSIIGFGRYRYRYESGREGEMCRIGLSPRKGQTVLYLVDGHDDHAALLARLGRHKIGKSCLYIRKLADIDLAVLERLIAASLATMAERYPPSEA